MTAKATGDRCPQCDIEIKEDYDMDAEGMPLITLPHSCIQTLKRRIDQLEQKLENLSDYVSRCARGDGD